MKRYCGECYDCEALVRCDEGGLACYHIPYQGFGECPGSREAVKPHTFREDLGPEPVKLVRQVAAVKLVPPPRNALVALKPPVVSAQLAPVAPAPLPKEQLNGEDHMASTHPAFVGARGVAVDMEARKKAVIQVATKFNLKSDAWPTRGALAQLLGTHPDTLGKVVAELEEDNAAYLDDDGSVVLVVPDEASEEVPTPKPKANGATKNGGVKFDNLDVPNEDARFSEDELYKIMVEERNTLEIAVKELSEQLEPKKVRLDRVRRSLKAYVAEK